MKRMLGDRKTLYFILSIVLVFVFTLTVVYAALNTVLKITGNAEVVASNWDIYLDNPQVVSGSVNNNVPTISNKTTASFSTTLINPGDYYEFTIDIINDGSIDAMIDSVVKTPELTTEQSKYLNYIVEYQNGELINTKQLVEKNSFVRLKVKVEFRKDILASDLPSTSQTLNLSFTVKYVQSDDNGISSIKNNGVQLVRIVNGDYDTVGSEMCIGKECFYVISSDDDSVTMLAKYNLYVGYIITEEYERVLIEDPTGIQDSRAIGETYNLEPPFIATTAYADSSQMGEKYSDYNGSIVEGYVNSYSDYLSSLSVNVIEARIITKDELVDLGCIPSDLSCRGAPSWVYTSSYWTSTAYSDGEVWFVGSGGFFDGDYNWGPDYKMGVRPVITISKSLI